MSLVQKTKLTVTLLLIVHTILLFFDGSFAGPLAIGVFYLFLWVSNKFNEIYISLIIINLFLYPLGFFYFNQDYNLFYTLLPVTFALLFLKISLETPKKYPAMSFLTLYLVCLSLTFLTHVFFLIFLLLITAIVLFQNKGKDIYFVKAKYILLLNISFILLKLLLTFNILSLSGSRVNLNDYYSYNHLEWMQNHSAFDWFLISPLMLIMFVINTKLVRFIFVFWQIVLAIFIISYLYLFDIHLYRDSNYDFEATLIYSSGVLVAITIFNFNTESWNFFISKKIRLFYSLISMSIILINTQSILLEENAFIPTIFDYFTEMSSIFLIAYSILLIFMFYGVLSLYCKDSLKFNFYRNNSNKILSTKKEFHEVQEFSVVAIVPNFNHANFLKKRLDSILNQDYKNIKILILDDNSSDNSKIIIEEYKKKFPDKIEVIFNKKNSGNVFSQWENGYNNSESDLVWICESDDYCDSGFLSNLTRAFTDESVLLAFGNIQYIDHNEKIIEGLDRYRNSTEPGVWDKPIKRFASEWFSETFSEKNLIPNVGGCVWRRGCISPKEWQTAKQFQIMGDWYLYSVIAKAGKIEYNPNAISFFRQHTLNHSSGIKQSTSSYYHEYVKIFNLLSSLYSIKTESKENFIMNVREVFDAAVKSDLNFDSLITKNLCNFPKPKPHILIGIYAFSYGGGEIFPISLANSLHSKGIKVSVLALDKELTDQRVRKRLVAGIPVYYSAEIAKIGVEAFIEKAGLSLIHSHNLGIDSLFLSNGPVDAKYLVTLHGSYESIGVSLKQVRWMSSCMDRIVFLTTRNLEPFRESHLERLQPVKIPNGFLATSLTRKVDRNSFGIDRKTVIFLMVARGIYEKGWLEAIKAFEQLQAEEPEKQISLLLAGEGPAIDKAHKLSGGNKNIYFLGFREDIADLMNFSDVFLLPSKFKGESHPLAVLEAIASKLPIIASDLGEIPKLINSEEGTIGILLRAQHNRYFVSDLKNAMKEMLDDNARGIYKARLEKINSEESMNDCTNNYIKMYNEMILI